MMRSLYSAVSGLKNHQTRMDVIGNNIANINTTGFKANRVNFSSMLSQNLSAASSPQGNLGGVNAKQIGLGSAIASIDTLTGDGSVQSTGQNTDLAISGNGYFVLKEGEESYYTRDGSFRFDEVGNYVSAGGLKVQGWMADEQGAINTTSSIEDIIVPAGQTMNPKATTKIDVSKNLSAETQQGAKIASQILVYDAEGMEHKVNIILERATVGTSTSTWNVDVQDDQGNSVVSGGNQTLTFDGYGKLTSNVTQGVSITLANGAQSTLDFNVVFDPNQVTQYSGDTTLKADPDGYTTGTLDSVDFDSVGCVIGTFSNGQKKTLAQVAMATFNNPGGLESAGSNLYSESKNSGAAQISASGANGAGEITPSALEMSNANLGEQFTDMIVTQRGYQSNSKIITVSDEMLETAINMKR